MTTPTPDPLAAKQEAAYRERVASGGFYAGGPVDLLLRELDETRSRERALLDAADDVKRSLGSGPVPRAVARLFAAADASREASVEAE